jgi:nucleotidyltransferase/DNA polymerase involved in DNA repair
MGRRKGRACPTRRPLLLHLDIDAFLASVEQLSHPRFFGKPVAVGTGVVASRSYEAKRRGVKTAMPLRKARLLCPELIVCEGDAQRAALYRDRVGKIVARYAPAVEMASLDDLYAEWVTGDSPVALAQRVQREVRQETGLSVSIGLGATKTLARLATIQAKPGGVYRVRSGEEESFLDRLQLAALPGLGPKMAKKLREYGIQEISDLRLLDYELLKCSFGAQGTSLYWKVRGLPAGDRDRRINLSDGSIGGVMAGGGARICRSTSLFEASADRTELSGYLAYLLDRAASALRARAKEAGRLSFFADPIPGSTRGEGRRSFHTRIQPASQDAWTFYEAILPDLDRVLQERFLVYRLGVELTNLTPLRRLRQTSLFEQLAEDPELRRVRLTKHMDLVRERHGFGAVIAGASAALIGHLAQNREGYRLRTPSLTL